MENSPSHYVEALNQEFIMSVNNYLGLPDDALMSVVRAVDLIKMSHRLVEIFSIYHHSIFDSSEELDDDKKEYPSSIKESEYWPAIVDGMGESADMFSVVVLISGIPHLLDYYEKKAIPEKVLLDTLSDVSIWMVKYYQKRRVWGLDTFPWLINHFMGKLYRLGRLQFNFSSFTGNIKVFRHKLTGWVVALSEPGVHYRKDGQIDGTNNVFDKERPWVSWYKEESGFIVGYPISPEGYAIQKLVRLSREVWIEALSRGDIVLGVHIPAGSKMSHNLCKESFSQAVEFFPTYFPDLMFKGFGCISWLLGKPLQELVSSSSNIVRFQREFYLYPYLSDDFDTFELVFGGKPKDLAAAPNDTQLRRAILNYVKAGNHVRTGAGFVLRDDSSSWGKQVYQSGDQSSLITID